MVHYEGYPSYEDGMTSNRRGLMDILAGQEEATLGYQLDDVISPADLEAAREAFDGHYLSSETEPGDI